jgi:hypothetical protein
VQVSPWYARVLFPTLIWAPQRENRLVCTMVSLLTGKCVPPATAMTSEVRVSQL